MDITAKNFQLLNRAQENMPENKWLQKHCKDYGFVLRYPKGRETVTGYSYEPWHFRYVGKSRKRNCAAGHYAGRVCPGAVVKYLLVFLGLQ